MSLGTCTTLVVSDQKARMLTTWTLDTPCVPNPESGWNQVGGNVTILGQTGIVTHLGKDQLTYCKGVIPGRIEWLDTHARYVLVAAFTLAPPLLARYLLHSPTRTAVLLLRRELVIPSRTAHNKPWCAAKAKCPLLVVPRRRSLAAYTACTARGAGLNL
eukprot:474455-Pelagomonas_calceolata.AAC.1